MKGPQADFPFLSQPLTGCPEDGGVWEFLLPGLESFLGGGQDLLKRGLVTQNTNTETLSQGEGGGKHHNGEKPRAQVGQCAGTRWGDAQDQVGCHHGPGGGA